MFQLKAAVGVDTIRAQEERLLHRAVSAWTREPTIQILGNLDAERLSIVSFVVKAPSGRYLHHNFVVAVLNDLFGISPAAVVRAPDPTATPCSGSTWIARTSSGAEIAHGCEVKPGWVRVNFNYFVSDEVTDYIVDAVRLIARDGWRLLPDYRFDNATGRWRHREARSSRRCDCEAIRHAADGSFVFPRHTARAAEGELAAYLIQGARILAERADDAGPQAEVSPGYDDLRWFELPAACMP